MAHQTSFLCVCVRVTKHWTETDIIEAQDTHGHLRMAEKHVFHMQL